MTELSDYQQELKRVLRRKFRGAMTPTENVLYFPNNLDVRICPKNGMSTLKWVLLYCMDIEISRKNPLSMSVGTKNWRTEQIKTHGYRDQLPYRKDSIRITAARDPVKRFLSACEYIKTEWLNSVELFNASSQEEFTKLERLSDLDELPDDLDSVIDMVWKGDVQNSHFFTQTYYLGSRCQYDRIYKMRDFSSMLYYIRTHVQTTKKIDRVHANKTSGLYYGPVDSLTEKQRRNIVRIYEEDYDYGWTED